MEKYNRKFEFQKKNEVFKNQFDGQKGKLHAKYGLPAEVKFCSRCVISNQRPNSAVEFQHTAASKKATINFNLLILNG